MKENGIFENGIIIILILFISLLGFISFISWEHIYHNTIQDNYCLEKIAKNQCSEKLSFYKNIFFGARGWTFSCVQDERDTFHETFLFLEKELNECGRGE